MDLSTYVSVCYNMDAVMVVQNGNAVYLTAEHIEAINELIWERDEEKRKARLASKGFDVA